MGDETEEMEIEVVDSETEGVESDNEVVDKKVIPPERLPNSQATRSTKDCVGRSLLKESLLTDYQCTPSVRTMEYAGRSVLYRTCIFNT